MRSSARSHAPAIKAYYAGIMLDALIGLLLKIMPA